MTNRFMLHLSSWLLYLLVRYAWYQEFSLRSLGCGWRVKRKVCTRWLQRFEFTIFIHATNSSWCHATLPLYELYWAIADKSYSCTEFRNSPAYRYSNLHESFSDNLISYDTYKAVSDCTLSPLKASWLANKIAVPIADVKRDFKENKNNLWIELPLWRLTCIVDSQGSHVCMPFMVDK